MTDEREARHRPPADDTVVNQVNGVLRAVVPAAVAYLAGKGLLPSGEGFVGLVMTLLVAAVPVGAAVWSWRTNKAK